MALPVIITGPSGSGKSTSMRTFDPAEVAIVNVESKPLPFKRTKDGILNTDDYKIVEQAILNTEKKAIVIDDAGYLITNYFMRNHNSTGAGNNVFQMYNQMADDFWELIHFIKNRLDDNKVVYIMMHEDVDELNGVKPKTIGKLLDEKVCIEGMVTIVLRAFVEDGDHKFRVHSKTNGDITKTPIDMFKEDEIDNDLRKVDSAIREYYELEPLVKVDVKTAKKGDK